MKLFIENTMFTSFRPNIYLLSSQWPFYFTKNWSNLSELFLVLSLNLNYIYICVEWWIFCCQGCSIPGAGSWGTWLPGSQLCSRSPGYTNDRGTTSGWEDGSRLGIRVFKNIKNKINISLLLAFAKFLKNKFVNIQTQEWLTNHRIYAIWEI